MLLGACRWLLFSQMVSEAKIYIFLLSNGQLEWRVECLHSKIIPGKLEIILIFLV